MAWDWEKLKTQAQYEKDHPTPKWQRVLLSIGESVYEHRILALTLVLLGAVLFFALIASNAGGRHTSDEITAQVLQALQDRDRVIADLANVHRNSPDTHIILERHGLKLGEDGTIYVQDDSPLLTPLREYP